MGALHFPRSQKQQENFPSSAPPTHLTFPLLPLFLTLLHRATSRLFIKLETEGTGKPYLNLYEGVRDKNGKPMTGLASTFISHAWKMVFDRDVLAVLELYAKEHPNAYFW